VLAIPSIPARIFHNPYSTTPPNAHISLPSTNTCRSLINSPPSLFYQIRSFQNSLLLCRTCTLSHAHAAGVMRLTHPSLLFPYTLRDRQIHTTLLSYHYRFGGYIESSSFGRPTRQVPKFFQPGSLSIVR